MHGGNGVFRMDKRVAFFVPYWILLAQFQCGEFRNVHYDRPVDALGISRFIEVYEIVNQHF
jgi:hypothetical protein